MARVGRGRARGGRILDISELSVPSRGMGHGRIMVGRGTLVGPTVNFKEDTNAHLGINTYKPSDVTVKDTKKNLETQLSEFQQTGKGCFLHITLNYFASSDDVQYYIDKVTDYLLKSSIMVEKFTMCFRLISLLKSYGEDIKLKMFSKLQTVFQDTTVLMKGSCGLSEMERERIRNFCELLGQLYFRFRLHIDSLERYSVLAAPTINCMSHLVTICGHQELRLLLKLIILNCSVLFGPHEEKLKKLSLDIHRALVTSEANHQERTWLLCALDYISYQSKLPSHLTDFYTNTLDSGWLEVVTTPQTQVLADIPPDIVQTQMDKFNVVLEEYNKYRFIYS